MDDLVDLVQKNKELEEKNRYLTEQLKTAAKSMEDFGSYVKVIVGERYSISNNGISCNYPPTDDYMQGLDEEFDRFEKAWGDIICKSNIRKYLKK